MSATNTPAPFASSYDALTYAYRFNHQQYERPLLNRQAAGPSVGCSGLSGLDGAGMAGSIRRHVTSMDPLAQAIIGAQFEERTTGCKCCGQSVPRLEWKAAVRFVAECATAQALTDCKRNPELVFGIVARLFGMPINLGELAEKCEASANTASNLNGKIKRWLRGVRAAVRSGSDEDP